MSENTKNTSDSGGSNVGSESEVQDGEIEIENLDGIEDIQHPEIDLTEETEEIPEVGELNPVVDEVKEYFDNFEETDGLRWGRPSDEFIEDNFFDFSYLDDYTEIERYWVNKPYAYVSVLHDEEARDDLYHVVEPSLDKFEDYVSEDLRDVLRDVLLYVDFEDKDRQTRFDEMTENIISEYAGDLDTGSLYKIHYYLKRHFVDYGKIDPIIRDPAIEDISCDGTNVPVFVYHRAYRDLKTNVRFEKEQQLNSFIIRLAQRGGKHISISNPLVDSSLPDGSRIQLTLGTDISARGSNFTVRKFSDVPITPVDLVKWNTFSLDQMAYFWLCIENNKSLVFAGGTASGKTTSMNAVSFFIPPKAKVISIEDTREITLPHENWVQSVTRQPFATGERGSVDMYDLLQTSLRHLLVGEIRAQAEVALTFFQAIATGHTSYTTFHADSVESLINRLENEPLNVPRRMVQALDIVAVQRQIYHEGSRVRRSYEIVELDEGSDGGIRTNALYRWTPKGDKHERVGNSLLLEEIKDIQGWDDARLDEELEIRKEILGYMVDNDITDYREIGKILEMCWKDREHVLDQVRQDGLALDPMEITE
ncbi:MAG: type II/IV secretion system ATPase subunit [Halobacteria archaeon]|nr:type II/IV secretion system ATPase subunit [Halobacteria archaeon]